MNCPNCQNPLPPDVAFCPVCGCQVIQEPSGYTDDEPRPKKSATKIIVAIIAVVLVLAVAGTAVFFILKNKDDQSERPSVDRTTTSQSSDDDETKAANGMVTTNDVSNTTADSQITASTSTDSATAATSASNANLYEPETHYSPVVYYVSSPDGLLLKSGPGMNYDTLMKIANGSAVEIRGGAASDKNWVYIYYADANVYGWINNTLISSSKTQYTTAPTSASYGTYGVDAYSQPNVEYFQTPYTAYVITEGDDRLMLRSSPDTSTANNIRYKMPSGSVVQVLGRSTINPNWLYVRYVAYGEQYVGFASGEFIS